MSDGQYVLPGPDSVSLSGDAARRLIGCGSGDAALLYLYILVSGGRYDRDGAIERIGRTGAQLDAALDVLARLGLVEKSEPVKRAERPDELPQYTSEDIERELDHGVSFRQLVDEVQRALGKLLSTDDMKRLFGIYDYLGLPADVILMLVNHCLDECRQRSGPGRVPTMRYIEKSAFIWEREGVFSIDAAERYLMGLAAHRAAEDELAGVLGIRGRSLSASERRYIDGWTDMGFAADAVALAFDRTVIKTGRLTWRYMDSILKSWHSHGLHTVPEIEFGDAPKAHRTSSSPPGGDPPTAEDLADMRETLRRIKGEE